MLILSQLSQLLFLYDQSSLEKNPTKFFHEEVNKNLLKQTLQKLVGGDSEGEERHLHSKVHYHISWDKNNKSIQDLEFSKMCVGSVIICDEPNFEVRSWIWEPSKLLLSISHCLDFALKLPIIIVRNRLQLDNESGFSSRFDLNIWNLSCVCVEDLYRWMKQQILGAILTSKLMHSFGFEIFSTIKVDAFI